MKKEKTVRTYQRRTKSGKMVTVREHKASYDAAEEIRKAAAKKIGAGTEFIKKKTAPPETELPFTPEEFKEWYHWDMEDDAKNKSALKVEKELKSKMGTRAYKKYLQEMTDSYTARGHNKAHKALMSEYFSEKSDTPAKVKSKVATKDIVSDAKEKASEAKSSRGKVSTAKSAKSATSKGKPSYSPYDDVNELYKEYKKAVKSNLSKKELSVIKNDLMRSMGVAVQHGDNKANKLMKKIVEETGVSPMMDKFYKHVPQVKEFFTNSGKSKDNNGSSKPSSAKPTEGKSWESVMKEKYPGSTGKNAEIRSLLGVSHSMRMAPSGYTKGAVTTAIKELRKEGSPESMKMADKIEKTILGKKSADKTSSAEKKNDTFTEKQILAYERKLMNTRNKYVGGPGPSSYRNALKKRQEAMDAYHKTDEGKAMQEAYKKYSAQRSKEIRKKSKEQRLAKKVEEARKLISDYEKKNTNKSSAKPKKAEPKTKKLTEKETMPAVKGLFKKGQDLVGNGWGNVDRRFLRDKIEGKLVKAGYKLVGTRNKGGAYESEHIVRKYTHPKYGNAYVNAVSGGEDHKGRFSYGNVDIYRGDYGKKLWGD